MRTRIVDNLSSFSALREAWTRLEPHARLPMQQFIWSQTAATAFTREGELRILVLEDNDHVVAVAPLVQPHGTHRLELLAVEESTESIDVLCGQSEVVPALAKALVDLKIPLLLKHLPEDSALPKALSNAFHGHGTCFCRPDGGWPWIKLDPSWEAPENHLNAGRRSDFRRAQRKAQELGDVKADIMTPTLESLPALLEEAFKVEAASWKGMTGSALALDKIRGSFYRQYTAAACERGILRLSFLRIGGQTAAMQIALESNGGFWLLKIGYDNQFAKCSPGNLLLRETLRYAALRGLKSYEFLGAVESWIGAWTDLERRCVTVRGYPFNFYGATTFASDAARSACQKLLRLRRMGRHD